MKRTLLIAIIIAAVAFTVGLYVGRGGRQANVPDGTTETTETIIDTITDRAPKLHAERATGGYGRYILPTSYFVGGVESRQQIEERYESRGDSDRVHEHDTGAGGEPPCSPDSAIVELPTIQRHYADGRYEAWVSGPIDPRLDSVRVFAPTSIITKREWKPPKRWHVGVTAGYGYGAKGFQPYIGVGITYSIFSF